MLSILDLSHQVATSLKIILHEAKRVLVTTKTDPVGQIPNCVISIPTKNGKLIRAKTRRFATLTTNKVKELNDFVA